MQKESWLWVLLLCLLFLVSRADNLLGSRGETRDQIGICTAVRREGLILIEWVEYHSLIGVDNFYIYIPSNETMGGHETSIMFALLEPYLSQPSFRTHSDRPTVILRTQESHKANFSPQARAYDDCAREFANQNEWLFFIDVDEFVAFPHQESLRSVLSDIVSTAEKDIQGLCVGWTTLVPTAPYNSPEAQRSPHSLITEVIDHSVQFKRSGKLALNTRFTNDFVDACHFIPTDRSAEHSLGEKMTNSHHGASSISIHNCLAGSSYSVISPAGTKVSDIHCKITDFDRSNQKLTLYHYFTRTCHEWSNELLQKRIDWNINRGGLLPSNAKRYDPLFCETISRQHDLNNAPYLQRFNFQLTQRVTRHPMWGSNINFFLHPQPNQAQPNNSIKPHGMNFRIFLLGLVFMVALFVFTVNGILRLYEYFCHSSIVCQ